MCNSALFLIILAASLVGTLAKPADIVARVPSDYYLGTKWVLFRDDSIPDPPPNVIQAENNVQVLPANKYQHVPSFTAVSALPVHLSQIHVTQAPLHVPVHVTEAPFLGDHDTEVVDSQTSLTSNQFQTAHGYAYTRHQQPIVKVSEYGLTGVPHTSVRVTGPTYFDYLRKKKSA